MHRKTGYATSSSVFKCKDDSSNLCTWGVADQVDKAPTSALPHANLQSSESERASAKCYCPLLRKAGKPLKE